jgi:hypothetical protein
LAFPSDVNLDFLDSKILDSNNLNQ